MNPTDILVPAFVLAAWTFVVLSLIPVARFSAARRGQVGASDFRLGESARVPERVSLPNRNYMNLLELPMLFYVVVIVLYVTGTTGGAATALAWLFVALRVLHSVIHLTVNHVFMRLTAFALGNVALVGLWAVAASRVLAGR